jgi:hypothetical protein
MGMPITAGDSHKKEELSNSHGVPGVPGVPGEEIEQIQDSEGRIWGRAD